MKKLTYALTLLALMAANTSYATESVPMLINLQSVVVDNGGNRLSDLTQVAEFDFWIKDSEGNILFEERQELPVVKGAISALVGESTTGGIPLEALAPDGDRILEFKLVDDSISQETTQIISVPYSYYAEAIAGGVNTEDINDGQVGLEDLNDEVLAILNTDETGEPTTTLDADDVTFDRALVYAPAGTVLSVITDIDHAILIHTDRMDMIDDDIDAVEATAADLQSQIDTEETARTAADTALQDNITSEASTRAAADTTLTTAVTTAQTTANTANTAAAAAQSDADAAQSDANAAQADADAAQSTANTARNEAQNAQDTADALGTRMDTAESTLTDHETRIDDLEALNEDQTPTYESVNITGSPTGDPDEHTQYKDNMAVAWGRIDGDLVTASCNSTGLVAGFNVNCVEKLSTGTYAVYFSTKPSSSSDGTSVTTYAVTTSSMNDNVVYVSATYSDYFVIEMEETQSGSGGHRDGLMMFSVYGWE